MYFKVSLWLQCIYNCIFIYSVQWMYKNQPRQVVSGDGLTHFLHMLAWMAIIIIIGKQNSEFPIIYQCYCYWAFFFYPYESKAQCFKSASRKKTYTPEGFLSFNQWLSFCFSTLNYNDPFLNIWIMNDKQFVFMITTFPRLWGPWWLWVGLIILSSCLTQYG